MHPELIQGLDLIDQDWSSDIETIEGKFGEITVVKVIISAKGRRRTGVAPVFYNREGSNHYVLQEATDRAFEQAAKQFGVTIT